MTIVIKQEIVNIYMATTKNHKRSTEGCSKFKSPETRTISGEIGLDIRTHASGTGPGVGGGGGKCHLLALRTRCKCSMDTCIIGIEVKFGSKVQISKCQTLV